MLVKNVELMIAVYQKLIYNAMQFYGKTLRTQLHVSILIQLLTSIFLSIHIFVTRL